MRSVDSGDLTTRARIRNAAIELIAEHGAEKASMRMIAQAAGVSPALVVHHFGDKNGLRAACTAHVVGMFTAGDSSSQPTIETLQSALSDLDTYGPAMKYLMRILVDDDSRSADELFDNLLQGTLHGLQQQEQAGLIRPRHDPTSTALLLTIWGLAPLVLSRHFARALGADELRPDALARITIPMLELLTHGLYTDDSILKASKSAMESEENA